MEGGLTFGFLPSIFVDLLKFEVKYIMYIRIDGTTRVTRDSERGKAYLKAQAEVVAKEAEAKEIEDQERYFIEVDKLKAEAKATLEAFK